LFKVKLIIAALVAALFIGGVPAWAQAPTPTPNEPLAALVNGKIRITLAELDKAVNRQLEARKAIGDAVPADLNAFRETVLMSLIQQALIEEAAAIQGIVVTDAEVEKEFQDYITAAGGKEKLLALITADRMTEEEWRKGLRSALITNRMRDIVTQGIGTTAEMVRARHILVGDAQTANSLLNQLQRGGDFAKLASQYSLDQTTKLAGGELGWFPRGQLLQKTVEEAAFALQPNQTSAPVKSELGYHLIQVLERGQRPLDPATRARLQEATFEAWLQTIVKQAQIVKFPPS
jgi:peptidyl-prolyl cis-trans isomerase C